MDLEMLHIIAILFFATLYAILRTERKCKLDRKGRVLKPWEKK